MYYVLLLGLCEYNIGEEGAVRDVSRYIYIDILVLLVMVVGLAVEYFLFTLDQYTSRVFNEDTAFYTKLTVTYNKYA